jgi:tRNA(Ile)-lysidine synthetase-like protein
MNRPNRPDGLVSRTREAFLRNRIPLDAPTVLGVSGGIDSMSLLHALWELRVPVEARHVNYGLRGADSDADEAAVRATCEQLGIPLRVHRADPPPSHAPDGLQAWARRNPTSSLFITAHHADDQTETVLLHLLRAADPLALAGMRELSTDRKHFRPWLRETRAEIQRYATARGVEWREDASNRSQVYLRNRIRHEVVPLLEALRPGAAAHVAQLAQRFAPLADAAERAVVEAEARCVEWDAAGKCTVDVVRWRAEPLRDDVLVRAVAALGGEASVAAAIGRLAGEEVEGGKGLVTAGLQARRERHTLRIERRLPPP